MPLTDTAVRRAKAKNKAYKLFDTDGLYLVVNPNGGKWWRLKYYFHFKERLLSLGTYPEVSLKAARDRRDEERKKVAVDIDPVSHRKASKAAWAGNSANSFEVVAREWMDKQATIWSPSNLKKVKGQLELNLFPYIGKRPIAEIQAPELLRSLRRIESRGAMETAHRLLGKCGQIFRYAIVTERATRNPAADLRGALQQKPKTKHLAAVTDPSAIGGLLRALHGYEGSDIVRHALRLAPLVFVRPVELRKAEWKHVNLEKAEWNIPSELMKMREPHLVPLARQAVEILKDLQRLTGRSDYLFPSPRSFKRPMSDNAVLSALRRMGIPENEMSGHGFRAMARTVLDEVLHVRPDYIEHQLAHAVRDPNGRAYNRTAHLPERRKMMQQWADYLDELRDGKRPSSAE